MQGAENFAAFYIQQVNKSWSIPDDDQLTGLSLPSCKTCLTFLSTAQDLEAKRLKHDGLTLKVKRASAIAFTDSQRRVAVYVDQYARRVVDKSGNTIRTTKPGTGAFVMTLDFEGHWMVSLLQTASR